MPRQKCKTTARVNHTFPSYSPSLTLEHFLLDLSKIVKSGFTAYPVKNANLRLWSIFFPEHWQKKEYLHRKYTAFGPLVIARAGWLQLTDKPGFKLSHLGWIRPRIISLHRLPDLLLAAQQAPLLYCHQLIHYGCTFLF